MAISRKLAGVIELTLDDLTALNAGHEVYSVSYSASGESVLIRMAKPDINNKGQVLDALGLRPTSVMVSGGGGGKSSFTRLSDGQPIGSPPKTDA